MKRSRVTSKVKVGDNVTVSIPSVNRGRTHPRNIIGITIAVSENNMYSIAVKGGVLNGRYSRNQFDECATSLFSMDDFCNDKQVSLRLAAQQESNCGGQGYAKCNCGGSNRCKSNKCKCFKAKVKCNSRCHSLLHCTNKQ